MRKEKWTIGNFVHFIRRSVRGLPFNKDDSDRWYHLKEFRYLNDTRTDGKAMAELDDMLHAKEAKLFDWPKLWTPQESLITFCGFTILDNHDHGIALEISENGLSKFMHKISVSKARYFNEKYHEKGGLFQGTYQARVIDSDKYLRWVVPYVMCKNTFEMHPKGLEWAVKNFEEAWEWGIQYPFSSLGDYAGARNSPIVDTAPLQKILGGPKEFKELCRDMILGRNKEVDGSLELEMRKLSFEQLGLVG